MKINYRVLSVDEAEHSIVVRYWTDEISEEELAGRAEYNLTIWPVGMSEAELHDAILEHAPTQWLDIKEKIKNPNIDTSMTAAKAMINQSRSGTIERPKAAPVEEDITHLVGDPKAKVDGPVYLYRAYIKTNDGPWTVPTDYTPEEMTSIVNPYLKAQMSFCKGMRARPMVYWESSDVWVRRYEFDSFDNAKAMLAFHEDLSIPEVKAMRDLARKYADEAGTTYKMETRIKRVP